ncbi:acetyltransferase [Longilinea arvoryzae]|uniref:Acetyltransferase n=1 Tax=Longilinea arvoryzae TaxID=360412 RepID=A0A0S7BHN7_9CHLR|nr:GNAT family protein [Longilinea arvoryzae]GAP15097.1 acetyltransferase [Longilinea arvoryzae]
MSSSDSAFLIGKRVQLRPLEKSDLPLIVRWNNDPEVRGLTGEVFPSSLDNTQAWYDRIKDDPSRVWFIIEERETGTPIGEAGLLRIFPAWRTTDLTIIIGNKTCQGKGYGTEAITLLMDYAFGALALHRISIGVVGFNERALAFYEKVGFRREGIQRDGYFYNHQFSDFIMLSILEDEFRAKNQTA